MKFTLGQLALAACVAAAPAALEPRAVDDIDILNFALTLEHLEDAFYREGLSKFTEAEFAAAGYEPRVRFNVREISSDESTHVSFLTAAIKAVGAKPVKKCTYDFGLTDATSFMDLASVLEGVGVTAYLGAASLIQNKAYLTPAGGILTIEARHNSYIRDNHQPGPQSPFAAPFDVPQTISQVFTLASAFIVECPPNNPVLPAKAFPHLTALNTKLARAKDVIKFKVAPMVHLKQPLFGAFAAVTGPIFVPATVVKKGGVNEVEVKIPTGVAGQSYMVLTNSKSVADASVVAGPAIIEIQPEYTIGGFPM